jgi:hypothetical protein
MKMSIYSAVLMCSLIFVGCSTTKVGHSSSSAIAVTIPFDSYDNKVAFGYRQYNKFHVLLTNVSSEPVRVWQEWSRWGYYCLQIEIIEQNGTKHRLIKKRIEIYINAPDFVVLQPGGSVVWNVDLTSSVWEDLSWLPKDDSLNAKVRAIFTVKNQDDPKRFDYNYAKKYGVWTGQATSDMHDFTLYGARTTQTK